MQTFLDEIHIVNIKNQELKSQNEEINERLKKLESANTSTKSDKVIISQ